MNRIKYLLFAVFLAFIFVNSVNATELKLSSDSKEVVVGDNVSVKLEFDIDHEELIIDYCEVVIEAFGDVEFQEVQALNSWTITNKNVSEVLDITIKNYQNNLYGSINIANLKYSVNETGSLKITSVSCYDKANNLLDVVNYDNKELTINGVRPKNTELKSLKINNEELNPYFSPNIKSYSINNFESDSLSLEYELADLQYEDKVEVLVNDKVITNLDNIPYELSADNKAMLITININNTSSYNIFVLKSDSVLDNDYVQSITINGVALELEEGKFDYHYTVSDDVTSVEVLAELYDTSRFELGSSSNIPAYFNMPGKVVAVLNVVPTDNQSGIPAVTYTVTINNESYVAGVKNPNTADTSMYVVLGILIISLISSTVLYQKNLNAYK